MKIDFLKNKLEFADEIAELWTSEWSETKTSESIERQKNGLLAKANICKAPFVLVGYTGDLLVGTAALFENDLETMSELTPWLAGVYVKKEFRRQGYAKELVNAVVAEASKLGFDILYLHAEGANELYERLGWEKFCDSLNDRGVETTVYRYKILNNVLHS